MANEIRATYTPGSSLYAIIRNVANEVWNTGSEVFEAYNAGNYADYVVGMTEQGGTGNYAGDFPTAIPGDIYYVDRLIGAPPAEGDTSAGELTFSWDGSGLNFPLSSNDIPAIQTGLATEAGQNSTLSALSKMTQDNFIASAVEDDSPSTTSFVATGLSDQDDIYNDEAITFTTGGLQGLTRFADDYDGDTGEFSFVSNPWPSAPSDGDEFYIQGKRI